MTPTILLVEDNPITSKLVRFTLEKEGYVVVDAALGATAVQQFAATTPALVLLDLLLPDVDGFDLFRRLRELPRGSEVPILAFTGLLSPYDEARLSELGFDDVVSKPVEPSRLVQIVKGYIAPADIPIPAAGDVSRMVIVADDDAVQRKLVGLRLQRAGFRVVPATDGQDALERARAEHPYAIVSDVLMPRLDGFGLSMAVRADPALADTSVILISNSYLDSDDRTLARRAGADELLLRTTELRDVIELLRKNPATRRKAEVVSVAPDPLIERERVSRMMNQLDRQVAMQAKLTQRCSLLGAELAVLSGISEAVATEHDLESTLHRILASCFDAGGISLGALYLSEGETLRGVHFGSDGWSASELATFFGHAEVLTLAVQTQSVVVVPSEALPEARYRLLLERANARSLMITPLGYRGQRLGALVTMSRALDGQPSDRLAFAQALAGQISLALALARTFHAKDASERSAKANATVLRSILDSMAEGVLVGDEQGAITHWNQAAISILSLDPESTEPIQLDERHHAIAQTLRGDPVDRAEVRLRDPSGGERWLGVNSRHLDDDDAQLRGAVAVFRDVTMERANNARMLVSERMASLGTLAAGVGHEINNPLMAVLGNLEMAAADLDRARKAHGDLAELVELDELLSDAREGAERVRNIVRDLKLFSRGDTDERAGVDVRTVLESSLRMVANEIRHRATVIRDYQPVPTVYANESRLGQVFLNLLVNAAQAIPEGRASLNEIRVATSLAADGRVRVDVSDTGSGMTPEVAAQIFTPFFTTKPIGVGTGLGLSICHQLVTAVGGQITVDTSSGVGTTFSVVLPTATHAQPQTSARPANVANGGRARILVIDDEPMVGKLIARGLATAHDVTTVTDAVEALRQIGGGRCFDVVLCDIMMPDVSGIEFYDALERVAPQLLPRTIFISGGAFTTEANAFLERTRNPSIDKPIDIRALRQLIDEQLNAKPQGAS